MSIKPKKYFILQDFTWAILTLLLLSLPFWLSNLDLMAQSLFYVAPEQWPWIEHPFWDFIYRYGIFLGYVVAVFSLFMIAISYWFSKYIKWRKPALLMVFTLALGPGLLVNIVFKDQWGRPRPRDVLTFQGTEEFLYLWEKGKDNKGKSFPCGHCSMGFYLAVPFLFLRRKYKRWAYFFLGFGIFYGLLIGLARMMAGAHFLSDVLWAGGFVWLSALIGYYGLKIYKETPISSNASPISRRKAKRVTLIMGILLPILTLMLLLATPYISSKEFKLSPIELKEKKIKVLKTIFEEGTLDMQAASNFQVNYKINAFGFPNSKVRMRQWQVEDTSFYTLDKVGWFTEINPIISLQLPLNNDYEQILEVKEGKIILNLNPEDKGHFQIKIEKGDVMLKIAPSVSLDLHYQSSHLENQTSLELQQASQRLFTSENATLKLDILINQGTLKLSDSGN